MAMAIFDYSYFPNMAMCLYLGIDVNPTPPLIPAMQVNGLIVVSGS